VFGDYTIRALSAVFLLSGDGYMEAAIAHSFMPMDMTCKKIPIPMVIIIGSFIVKDKCLIKTSKCKPGRVRL
jgi:hypothetical protein